MGILVTSAVSSEPGVTASAERPLIEAAASAGEDVAARPPGGAMLARVPTLTITRRR